MIVDYQFLAPPKPTLYADQNCRKRIRGTPFETQLQEAGMLCWAEVPEASHGVGPP